MKQLVSVLIVIALNFSLVNRIGAQTVQNQDEVVRFRTNEVRLDIVVKDKKGHQVRDLAESDFEVLEDGVSQKIQSFRFVNREGPPDVTPANNAERKEGNAPSTVTTTQAVSKRTTPGIISLVFDRLSPDARSLAKKAGNAYAQEGMAAGDYTGVFRIDQSLVTLQPFTDNTELVKVAIDNATSAIGSSYISGAQRSRAHPQPANCPAQLGPCRHRCGQARRRSAPGWHARVPLGRPRAGRPGSA